MKLMIIIKIIRNIPKGGLFVSKNKGLTTISGNADIENMTLKELQSQADKILIEGNKTKIQKKLDDKVIKIEITNYPTGQKREISFNDISDKDKLYEAIRMKLDEKQSQADIALDLGVSQSYVSKVKNNKL